jgi:hypothetical protein
MLDKTYTFQVIRQVLRRDILPYLTNDMAKEQAVAILSLLKNLDANTIQNDEPFKSVNSLLFRDLEVSLVKMNEHASLILKDRLLKFKEDLAALAKQQQSDRNTWEALNELFCELIHFVYQNHEFYPFIVDLRKTMRKQIDIEIKTVH